MIFNTGSHLSPTISLEIGDVEVNYVSVTTVELDLAANKHDMLSIHMNGIPSKAITDYISAPVRFSITNGPGRSQTFVGYVLYVEPTYNASAPIVNQTMFYSAKIVCIGASVVMKNVSSRVWGSTNIYRIAQEMSNKYKFSLTCFKDSFEIRNAVQANESDWEFLLRMCETYGYSVTVHGTHMSIWDPFQAIGRRPSFERLTPQNAYAGPTPGAIVDFNGTFGYLTPEGKSYKYRISTVDDNGVSTTVSDPGSGVVESWSGKGETPLYTSTINGIATTIGEGQKMINAKRRKHFAFNATAKILAGAGTVPGGVVSVEGYESNFEGLWYVREVKHHVSKMGYFTDLLISKDYNTSNDYIIPPTTLYTSAVESKYTDGSWVAETQTVELYV